MDAGLVGHGALDPPLTVLPVAGRSSRTMAVTRFWILILAICGGSGVLLGAVSAEGRPGVAAVYGVVIGGLVMLYEQGVILPGIRNRVRRLPLVLSVVCTEAAYIFAILAGTALAGSLLKGLGVLYRGGWSDAVMIKPAQLFYALLVSGTLITVNRMRELIGAEVFLALLLGRYHQPVEEERIFLFLDLIGSTAYAQAHGDVRAQAFLGAIFAALAEPVRRSRGSIDDYIGDMALVTWPLGRGTAGSRCVTCVFDFLAMIARDRDRWVREFGQVPQFRAALHGGSVVTAEVGADRHKIAYFGDVVNTTGRLERLCRVLGAPVLISSELLARLPCVPHGVRVQDLGTHAVKGRGEAIAVFSLEIASPLRP